MRPPVRSADYAPIVFGHFLTDYKSMEHMMIQADNEHMDCMQMVITRQCEARQMYFSERSNQSSNTATGFNTLT